MSREIKFRAYDKEFKEYNDYHFNRTPLRDFTKNNTRFVLEQYTGLKDKNGFEIYEGDIILYQDCKGEVYYCNNTCMFMAKFKTTHSSWSFDSMDDEIEVIGKIHENQPKVN